MVNRCGQILSCALHGIDGVIVNIEVAVLPGLPSFDIVGLGDPAVRESRNRVHAALKNNGYFFPPGRITASYAPAWLHKAGSAFDLPLALALLMASGQVRQPADRICAFGELSLTGEVREVPGVICRMAACEKYKDMAVMVPQVNSSEAAAVTSGKLVAVGHLNQAVDLLRQGKLQANLPAGKVRKADAAEKTDITILGGQEKALRALQIAAAGRHNLLLLGSPGCGKSTLARLLVRMLPPLERSEALLVTRIHSAAGQLASGAGLLENRPLRMPHHGTGRAALMGGGAVPRPGEVSLAHLGVLFLDEMTEFRADVLDALRQPLEEHMVSISRLRHHYRYPADFILVGAANPCRCGEYYETDATCRCSEEQVKRHLGRISGPLLDRLDMVVEMTRIESQVLPDSICPGKSTLNVNTLRQQTKQCWDRQAGRCRIHGREIAGNGRVSDANLAGLLEIPASVARQAAGMAGRLKLSVRGYQKILRLARTIADINGDDAVTEMAVAEACQYRPRHTAENTAGGNP